MVSFFIIRILYLLLLEPLFPTLSYYILPFTFASNYFSNFQSLKTLYPHLNILSLPQPN